MAKQQHQHGGVAHGHHEHQLDAVALARQHHRDHAEQGANGVSHTCICVNFFSETVYALVEGAEVISLFANMRGKLLLTQADSGRYLIKDDQGFPSGGIPPPIATLSPSIKALSPHKNFENTIVKTVAYC